MPYVIGTRHPPPHYITLTLWLFPRGPSPAILGIMKTQDSSSGMSAPTQAINVPETSVAGRSENDDETQFAWVNVAFLFGTPLVAIVGSIFYAVYEGITGAEVFNFFFMYWATGLAITVGYHRYYSHRTFEARRWVQFLILLFGAASFQNPVLIWASNHRFHHRHVDREGDPYNIKKGFFFAHMAWMFYKENPDRPYANVADLKRDRLVMWQDKYYYPLVLIMCFGLPMLIGGVFFGRPWGGLLFGGLVRMVIVHHATFFINSLAHTLGTQPYAGEHTARDSTITAFFSFGEGYHNFHHAYPSDYRNGRKWWHYDPAKWTIWTLERLGQADHLRRVYKGGSQRSPQRAS